MARPRFRFRFTVRRMMAMVAVLALISAVEVTRRRRNLYKDRAAYHAAGERRMLLLLHGGFIHEADETGKRKRVEIGRGLDEEAVRRRLEFHSKALGKYERAARSPWLSVIPDPHEPEGR